MNPFETIIFEKDGPLAWLTLDRPQALNAVNLQMRDDLWIAFEAVRDDPDVRAVVIRGSGRAFSAGADISEFGTAPSYVEARRARHQRDLWGLMLALPKPMVAAIHGFALGAGLEMSLYCDLRIAAQDARLGLPEVNLGYIPSAGGTQTLPRTIAPGVAMEMILSGDPVDAAEALRLGLVHRVVPNDRLYPEAEAAARRLAALSPEAVRLAKEALREGLDLPLAAAVELESRLASISLAQPEAREGLLRRWP